MELEEIYILEHGAENTWIRPNSLGISINWRALSNIVTPYIVSNAVEPIAVASEVVLGAEIYLLHYCSTLILKPKVCPRFLVKKFYLHPVHFLA